MDRSLEELIIMACDHFGIPRTLKADDVCLQLARLDEPAKKEYQKLIQALQIAHQVDS